MKYEIEAGEVEIPMASAGAALVEEMKQLRNKVTDALGASNQELAGLARNATGEWIGVFQKKS